MENIKETIKEVEIKDNIVDVEFTDKSKMNIDAKTGEVEVKKETQEEAPKMPELPENSPLRRLVPPHTKTSRLVTEEDIERVVEESKILYDICFESYGIYHGAFAMHHSQIDEKDPLNFFVTKDREIIINPEIIRHSNYTVDSKEGCVSFPDRGQVVVQRWQKVDVSYVTIMVDPKDDKKFILSSKIEDTWTGMDAKVFQHEFDHGNAKLIHIIEEVKKDIIN